MKGNLARKHSSRVIEPVFRAAPVHRAVIVDEEKRIVDLSFSSEFEVLRDSWWEEPWVEILGHNEGEFDFSRLNNGATLLYNHRRTREDRLGGIISARVEGGRGIARVQFSANSRVDDVWDDVKAGLLSTVSVSYFILSRTLVEQPKEGAPKYRVQWQPFEVSFVDVPADWTVGAGRAEESGGIPPQVVEAFPALAQVRERGYTVMDLNPSAPPEGGRMKNKGKNANTRHGSPLAAMLAGAVAALATGDRTRDALVAELATASNLGNDEVGRILSGETVPERAALEAFAPVLNVPVDTLVELLPSEAEPEPTPKRTPATPAAPPGDVDARVAAALAADRTRQTSIRALVAQHRERLGTAAEPLLERCLSDGEIDEAEASRMILETIGRQVRPAGADPTMRITEDAGDKLRTGISSALIARGRIADPSKDPALKTALEGNHFRGLTLVEIARECLRVSGTDPRSLSRMEMVGRALTTSDLPNIMQDVLNKALLRGWDETAETWQLWMNVGSLSDFRAAKRVGIGSFDALEEVSENGEYKYGYVSDQGETIQLATYGKIIRVTRQAIINDDLSALTDLPMRIGRAASRTVGDVGYGILTSNPAMSDGEDLFSAAHSNDQTDALIGVDALSIMRKAMALQKDNNSAAHGLNIPVGFIITPVALVDAARQVVASLYDPRSSVQMQIPNPVRNIGEVIADPRLDADDPAAYYAAAPKGYDTIEVAFLDGNDTPVIEQREGWSVDGVEWKARIDVGAAARDYRGLQRNTGAP